MRTNVLTICEAREAYGASLTAYLSAVSEFRVRRATQAMVDSADKAVQVAADLYMEALRRPIEQLDFICVHK